MRLSRHPLLALIIMGSPSVRVLADQQCPPPQCPKGTILERYTSVGCSTTCISYFTAAIQAGTPTVGAIAAIVVGVIAYAGTRNTQQHTARTRDVALDLPTWAYQKYLVVNTIDGVHHTYNVTHDQMYQQHVSYFAQNQHVHGNVSVVKGAGQLVYLSHPDGWIATLNGSHGIVHSSTSSNGHLTKRDTLTGVEVFFHNALVFGSVQIRDFSNNEKQTLGYAYGNDFLNNLYRGRVMCACIESGYGNGYAAALSLHGQANNNGKYQGGRCDCDIGSHDELK